MNTRRAFLKSLASTLALPLLEPLRAASVANPSARPLRLAYIYLPNGVNTARWFPQGSGKNYQLSSSLAPLASHRDDFKSFVG